MLVFEPMRRRVDFNLESEICLGESQLRVLFYWPLCKNKQTNKQKTRHQQRVQLSYVENLGSYQII